MHTPLKPTPCTIACEHGIVGEPSLASDARTTGDTRELVNEESVNESLRQRLRAALRGKSIRTIAAETQTCPETVRRYFTGSTFSVEFLTKVCHRYGLSAEWLIFGRGISAYNPRRFDVIAETNPSLVIAEIARRWELVEARLIASHAITSVSDISGEP